MRAIGQKVILRGCADRSGKTGAKFLLQETNHLAHALEGETLPAKLADDCHGDEFVPVIDAAVALAARRHDAPLIPPLQLTGADSSQGDHVVGCKLSLHLDRVLFQTKK